MIDIDGKIVNLNVTNLTVPIIYRDIDTESKLYTDNITEWSAGTDYGTVYNDFSINLGTNISEGTTIFTIKSRKQLSSITVNQIIQTQFPDWDLSGANIVVNDVVVNDTFNRVTHTANSTSGSNIYQVSDTYTLSSHNPNPMIASNNDTKVELYITNTGTYRAVIRAVSSYRLTETVSVENINIEPGMLKTFEDVTSDTIFNLDEYFTDDSGVASLVYTVSSYDTTAVNAFIVGNMLYVKSGIYRDGSSAVTVTATDANDTSASGSFDSEFTFTFTGSAEFGGPQLESAIPDIVFLGKTAAPQSIDASQYFIPTKQPPSEFIYVVSPSNNTLISVQNLDDKAGTFDLVTKGIIGQRTVTVTALAVEKDVSVWKAETTFSLDVVADNDDATLTTAFPDITDSTTFDMLDYFNDNDFDLTFEAEVSEPDVVVVHIDGTTLTLTSALTDGTGTTQVTIRARDSTAEVSDTLTATFAFRKEVETVEIIDTQLYTIPTGLETIKIIMWGAGGSGSVGGYSEGVIDVSGSGGKQLYVMVANSRRQLSGVFDADGLSNFGSTSELHPKSILIAGGGSDDRGSGNFGGNGGGESGGNGGYNSGPHGGMNPGKGGSQSSGATGGANYYPSDNGTQRQSAGSMLKGGGTGGDGYWGGGEPGINGGGAVGGGGGSGYVGGTATYPVTNGITARSTSTYGGGTVPSNDHELYKNNFGKSNTAGGVYLILNGV